MAVLLFLCLATAVALSFSYEIEETVTLRPRTTAPLFQAKAVINDRFIDISLQDYQNENQWAVLLFYPFDYTFVCPTEIISFSDKSADFAELNTQVMAVSTDSHHTHLAWTRSSRENGGVGKLQIPLVADTSKRISASYGVLVTDPDDEMFGAALRGLFIIDPAGKIRSMQINDDQVGRSVDETLRLLKAFQFADAHPGEACPASWVPGSDTIKTNPYEAKEYFKTHYVEA